MVDEEGISEEEADFVTWDALKKRIFEDDELEGEDRIFLGPILRDSDGAEVGSVLDSLVLEFRKLWSEPPHDGRLKQEEEYHFRREVQICYRNWFRAFDCLRESERWFYMEFGPKEDREYLDAIAGSLDGLYNALDDMRAVDIDWRAQSEEDRDYIQESMKHLHEVARDLQDKMRESEKQSLPVESVNEQDDVVPGGLGVAVRSFSFLRRWLIRRIGEMQEYRHTAPSLLHELYKRPPEGDPVSLASMSKADSCMIMQSAGIKIPNETKAKAAVTDIGSDGLQRGHSEQRTPAIAWFISATPKGSQHRIDNILYEIFANARVVLEAGWKPLVQSVSIDTHVGRSALGVTDYHGRILWMDMQYRVPFWTLRSGEAARIFKITEPLVEWAMAVTPPSISGHSGEAIRDKLVQALYILRVNPYTQNPEFAMVAAGEMETALAKLREAENYLGLWSLIHQKAADSSAIVDDEKKTTKIEDHFSFLDGQVLFDEKDLGLPSGLSIEVLKLLHGSFSKVVSHEDLHSQSNCSEASTELRQAVHVIRKSLRNNNIGVEVKSKRSAGYVLQQC